MTKNIPTSRPTKNTIPSLPANATFLTVNKKVAFSFSDFICRSYGSKDFCNKFKRAYDYGEFAALLISRLVSMSQMYLQEIKSAGTSTRCHSIDNKHRNLLEQILIDIGFSKEKLRQIEDFYQVSLGTGNGRVIGHFVDNIFYIVLLDPYHLLYPNKIFTANQDLCNTYDPWEDLLH